MSNGFRIPNPWVEYSRAAMGDWVRGLDLVEPETHYRMICKRGWTSPKLPVSEQLSIVDMKTHGWPTEQGSSTTSKHTRTA